MIPTGVSTSGSLEELVEELVEEFVEEFSAPKMSAHAEKAPAKSTTTAKLEVTKNLFNALIL